MEDLRPLQMAPFDSIWQRRPAAPHLVGETPLAQSALEAVAPLVGDLDDLKAVIDGRDGHEPSDDGGANGMGGGAGGGTGAAGGMGGPIPADITRPHPFSKALSL